MKSEPKVLGFWSCWSLTVGIMIGSGIFLLPSVLAPYGLISFSGWLITASGSILLSLVFARLASRSSVSGGVYIYTKEAFGELPSFIIAWGYWSSYWIAIPAVAMAFVGYLSVFFPALDQQPKVQMFLALILMWASLGLNARGLKEAITFQLLLTLLKLVPLLLIIALGIFAGSTDNLPAANPKQLSWLQGLATTALITMWAFSGMEAGTVPAGEVKNPERTVPRAIVFGTVTVAFFYIASTAAVMMLVPAETLAKSTSPFADAAASLGSWGPPLIAIGALISTLGALNGTTFVAGQMPVALALDKLAPPSLASKNKRGGPTVSILLCGVLTTILLLANSSRGLIEAFTFLVMVSILAFMLPLIVCSLAEFLHSWRSAKGWAAVGMVAFLYSIFAVLGSGLEAIAWGIAYLICGIPLFYLAKSKYS